jgi:hypothetical protein
MSDTSCPLAHSDAAYVLGSLSPAERLEFERHLPGCAACRRSVAQLAGMPGLLARVTAETVEATVPPEPVPDTVLPALVTAVRREQRRKTLVLSLGAAAAIVAVAVGASALQSARDDGRVAEAVPTTSPTPTQAPAQAMTVVRDVGMRAEVTVTPTVGGTQIDLLCAYAKSEPDYGSGEGATYELVARDPMGDAHRLSDWEAVPGSTVPVRGMTSLSLDEIVSLEVRSTHYKKTILRLDL